MNNQELHEEALDLVNQHTNYSLARQLIKSNESLDNYKERLRALVNKLTDERKTFVSVHELHELLGNVEGVGAQKKNDKLPVSFDFKPEVPVYFGAGDSVTIDFSKDCYLNYGEHF